MKCCNVSWLGASFLMYYPAGDRMFRQMTKIVQDSGYAAPPRMFSVALVSVEDQIGLIVVNVAVPGLATFDLDYLSTRFKTEIDYTEFKCMVTTMKLMGQWTENAGISVKVKNYSSNWIADWTCDELESLEMNFQVLRTPLSLKCRVDLAKDLLTTFFDRNKIVFTVNPDVVHNATVFIVPYRNPTIALTRIVCALASIARSLDIENLPTLTRYDFGVNDVVIEIRFPNYAS